VKQCSICKLEKAQTDFYKDAAMPDGYRKCCKQCKNKKTQEWRNKNRAHYNARHREYNTKNYTKMRLQRYGITPAQHLAMLESQNHTCKMCKKPQTGKRPLVVDHCHATGAVRGLLCYGCNRGIAILDNPAMLEQAKKYLNKESI